MKTLHEIEKEYIKNIIDSSCYNALELFIDKTRYGPLIRDFIDINIRERLVETKFVRNYIINVNFNNVEDIRNNRIDQVLFDEKKSIKKQYRDFNRI